MDGYLISDVADRTGFTRTTLRYYEEIELLPEPRRTASGYRVYDPGHLELLGFIDGAKRLGLSLEEIRDLAPVWSRGHCASTRAKLEGVLDRKLEGIRAEIERLQASAHRLRAAREQLLTSSPPERCDDGCGCPPEIDAPVQDGSRTVSADGDSALR